jgi:hypothetical protein
MTKAPGRDVRAPRPDLIPPKSNFGETHEHIPEFVTIYPHRAHLNWPGVIMLALVAVSTGVTTAWIYTLISLMRIGQ